MLNAQSKRQGARLGDADKGKTVLGSALFLLLNLLLRQTARTIVGTSLSGCLPRPAAVYGRRA